MADPSDLPVASRKATRLPDIVALPVSRPLESRNVKRSPCRTAEPRLRPDESRKSEREAPLDIAECHCFMGNPLVDLPLVDVCA